uniref:SSURE domain-containing protein n=1 Tax=Weissella cibaria TaxID=137591 RepID=UPI001FD6A86E
MVNKKGIFATALFSSIILSPVAFASDTANSTNTNDSSEVQVANTDNTVSLDNTSNQGVSEDSITSHADTQSSALTQAVGGADTSTTLAEATSTTSADDVKTAVAQNIKSTVDVPASYLENANYPGPFT